jgi:hypothetical protein
VKISGAQIFPPPLTWGRYRRPSPEAAFVKIKDPSQISTSRVMATSGLDRSKRQLAGGSIRSTGEKIDCAQTYPV